MLFTIVFKYMREHGIFNSKIYFYGHFFSSTLLLAHTGVKNESTYVESMKSMAENSKIIGKC